MTQTERRQTPRRRRPAKQPEPRPEVVIELPGAGDQPREVEEQVAANLAECVVTARDIPGCSRSVLAQLTGFTVGAIWRIEQGRVRWDEVEKVQRVLDMISSEGLPEMFHPRKRAAAKRPTRGELEAKLAELGWTWTAGSGWEHR